MATRRRSELSHPFPLAALPNVTFTSSEHAWPADAGRASPLCYVGPVADVQPTTTYSLLCPHCQRRFVAELIEGPSERHRGFKCPHCKLFVPLERAEDAELVAPAPSA